MTVRVSLVRNHYITYGNNALREAGLHRKLTQGSWNFMSRLVEDDSTHAVVAYDGGSLVGWLRFTKKRNTIWAQGTWVERPYRRHGLAKRMWVRMIDRIKPREIYVDTISEGGRSLINSIEESYPELFPDHYSLLRKLDLAINFPALLLP